MAPVDLGFKDTSQQKKEVIQSRHVSDIDEALWRRFGDAAAPGAFCAAWLALQCRMIKGVFGGVVLLGGAEENRPFVPVAFWPDRQHDLKHLGEVAEQALRNRSGLILKRPPENDSG